MQPPGQQAAKDLGSKGYQGIKRILLLDIQKISKDILKDTLLGHVKGHKWRSSVNTNLYVRISKGITRMDNIGCLWISRNHAGFATVFQTSFIALMADFFYIFVEL
jgi:hypothetical protein